MHQLGNTRLDTNNFRLLALYTDIRLFDTEIKGAARKLALSSTGSSYVNIKKGDKFSMHSDLINNRAMIDYYNKSQVRGSDFDMPLFG